VVGSAFRGGPARGPASDLRRQKRCKQQDEWPSRAAGASCECGAGKVCVCLRGEGVGAHARAHLDSRLKGWEAAPVRLTAATGCMRCLPRGRAPPAGGGRNNARRPRGTRQFLPTPGGHGSGIRLQPRAGAGGAAAPQSFSAAGCAGHKGTHATPTAGVSASSFSAGSQPARQMAAAGPRPSQMARPHERGGSWCRRRRGHRRRSVPPPQHAAFSPGYPSPAPCPSL
jgi:hypothetical protein